MTETRQAATRLVSPADIAEALGLPVPTPEQAAVIAAPPEPALVVAGAGAGKTETMAARVVWLVANGLVKPDRVLGPDLHPQGRRAARRAGPAPGCAGSPAPGCWTRRPERTAQASRSPRASRPCSPTTPTRAGCWPSTGCGCRYEPGARMLSETASWQLAYRVVSSWDADLDTDKAPHDGHRAALGVGGRTGRAPGDAGAVCGSTRRGSAISWRTLPPGEGAAGQTGEGTARHRGRATSATAVVAVGGGLRAPETAPRGRWTSPTRCPWRRGSPRPSPTWWPAEREPIPGGAAGRVPGHRARPAGAAVRRCSAAARADAGHRGGRPGAVDLRVAGCVAPPTCRGSPPTSPARGRAPPAPRAASC